MTSDLWSHVRTPWLQPEYRGKLTREQRAAREAFIKLFSQPERFLSGWLQHRFRDTFAKVLRAGGVERDVPALLAASLRDAADELERSHADEAAKRLLDRM
jgi:hypothetical protein